MASPRGRPVSVPPVGSLLVVTGPPGAGKSTTARLLACDDRLGGERVRSAIVSGDDFFSCLVRGAIEPWNPGSELQNDVVIEAAATCAGLFARGGYATVYDGVVGPWYLEAFARATGLDRLGYAILLPSLERCVRQVHDRLNHGFRNEQATRDLHAQFARSEIDPRHRVIDPPEDPREVVDLVLDGASSGRFTYEVGHSPQR